MSDADLAELPDNLARMLGLARETAHDGLAVLLPAVIGGYRKALLADPSASDGLTRTLQRICGPDLLGGTLNDVPTMTAKGNMVLAEIFGFKDVSRAVALGAARSSGLDQQVLQRMLPIIAALIARRLVSLHGKPAAVRRRRARTFGGAGAAQRRDRQAHDQLDGLLDTGAAGNPLDDMLRNVGELRRHDP